MHYKPLPPQQFLQEALHYDPESGDFTWRPRHYMGKRWNARYANKLAGCVRAGVRPALIICFDKSPFTAHRIAWVYVHGSISETMQIDHANGNPLDNRLCNLRLATFSQNQCNKSRYRSNSSGFKGVHRHKRSQLWTARIQSNGKRIQLGEFSTPELAHAAYIGAAEALHGRFSRCV
jgi:hypothetical protein